MLLNGEAPFKILKTHGLIVDDDGTKISKSIVSENFTFADPDDLIEGSVKSDG
jgi:isoleucyl-tRNA synthetase